MAQQVQLAVDVRTETGKGAAHRLRSKGFIPAIMYGGVNGNIPLAVNTYNLYRIVSKGGWETTLIELALQHEGTSKKIPVLIKDLQIDPLSRRLVHADFFEVNMAETVEVPIPFQVVGEAPGVKEGGVLESVTRELTVECLPGKIVDHFTIDISALNIGDAITVAQLSLGEDYKIINPPDTVIVTVTAPMAEEVAAPVEGVAAAAPAEPEVIQKGKKEEEEE
jgi:large subunit ribosomal protein L25